MENVQYLLNTFCNIFFFFLVGRFAVVRHDLRVMPDPAEEEGVEGRPDPPVSQAVVVIPYLVNQPLPLSRGYDCVAELLSDEHDEDTERTVSDLKIGLDHLSCCW